MTLGTIENAALKGISRVLPLITKRATLEIKRQHLLANVRNLVDSEVANAFIESLSESKTTELLKFARSPEFDQILLHAIVGHASFSKEDHFINLRNLMLQSLRHTQVFAGADLTQATDVLFGLTRAAAYEVTRNIGSSNLANTSAAAHAAAAVVRNSEILQRLERTSDINKFAEALRQQVVNAHSHMRLPFFTQGQTAEYAELYVPPALDSEDEQGTSLADLMASNFHYVVLGDPGAGKSTLVAKFAHDIGSDALSGLAGRVPILLTVREHTKTIRVEQRALQYFLDASCQRPYSLIPPADALDYLLLNGRAVVIIDGFDELGDSQQRTSFARLVESFANLYPFTRIVVTSRSVGYRDAPLNHDNFPVARVKPFDHRRVMKYVDLWFGLDGKQEDQRRSLSSAFMRESKDAADLRGNALLLSLLCVLYTSTHYIPRNRPEIYERCAELLFETWDRTRGIETPYRFASHMRPAVQQIAWQLFTDRTGRRAVPRSEIQEFLTRYMLKERFQNEPDAQQAATDFLDFCAGRAWVLTEVGSDLLRPMYGFVHNTFMEFFAASQLVKFDPSPEALLNHIRPNIGDGSWDVVNQLSVQILNRYRQGGAASIVSLLLDEAMSPTCDRKASVDILEFVVRCLDVVAPDNATINRIAGDVAEFSCRVPIKARRYIGPDAGEYGLSGSIAWIDSALYNLLAVTFPDNAERLPDAVSSAIYNLASVPFDQTSASLVFQCLADRRSNYRLPLLPKVEGILNTKTRPESVRDWMRMSTHPAVSEIEALGGPLSLYEDTAVIDETYPSVVWRLLEELTNGNHEQEEPFLASIYGYLTEHASDFARITLSASTWSDRASRITQNEITTLGAPAAKASAVLLCLPILSSMSRSRLVDFEDRQIGIVSTARHEGLRRTRAIRILRDFGLPELAHSITSDWLYGRL